MRLLAMLIGCGLRRSELLALRVESIQLREEHWVIADLLGKAGHIRTVVAMSRLIISDAVECAFTVGSGSPGIQSASS